MATSLPTDLILPHLRELNRNAADLRENEQVHVLAQSLQPRDVGDLGVEETAAGEQLRGRFEDEVALVTRVL